jgi:hypothetical protein
VGKHEEQAFLPLAPNFLPILLADVRFPDSRTFPITLVSVILLLHCTVGDACVYSC